MVLCHGGPGLWDMFGDLAELLRDSAALHRWDQRGCGRSVREGPYTWERTLADLESVRRHFGLERMVLLGHSWGAQLALRYTLDHPERVSGLVYVSGTGIDPAATWREPYRRNFRARMGGRMARWSELEGRARSAAEERELCVLQWSVEFAGNGMAYARRMAKPWFGVNFACNSALNAEDRRTWGTAELGERCRACAVPALIVDGARDIRPRWAVDSLAEALPDVSRVVLADAGHLPWMEKPAEFRTAVTEFLIRVSAGQ
ncbi:alpha/beta fold hydrolase [Acrocarpospora corrugata]|uniref:alpha/beta fold hydrolase n=1 Tax=Acrocarpospora corrugata TaxID=35763 RepID=UPI001C3FC959|nr:alpha/beta hydrolase [Acrocarpospora corrugata]